MIKIPYVIDNQTLLMSDLLNDLLCEFEGRSMDVASAYFTLEGFNLLCKGLNKLKSFRFLIGAEPHEGKDIGLEPVDRRIKGLIRKDFEDMPFDEKRLRQVEDLIQYLHKDDVLVHLYEKGFLHAKCWIFYGDRSEHELPLFDRLMPIIGIAGSSNFTHSGLTSNKELNLAHKVVLSPDEIDDCIAKRAVEWMQSDKSSPRITDLNRQMIKSEVGARAILELADWFEKQWLDSRDFKDELIRILDESKFGQVEYTPYQVYMKALWEYFKDDLGEELEISKRSAVDLAEFQEDAVKKARKILARYDGVMIADSVGLGKTWIGKKLLEDYAYHMRQKALIVCPASLRDMWENELREATIPSTILSQEKLGQVDFNPCDYADFDITLIDESHNFRNKNTQRWQNIEIMLGMNGKCGRDGQRKKIILLTATPINNDLLDLYNQFNLIALNDKSYFVSAGIGDLHKFFLRARREFKSGLGSISLFNLLEEIVIRRTRPFIKKVYPEAKIKDKVIRFPERRLRTVTYNLEETYSGIYDEIVNGIENLHLAPYNLESYKKDKEDIDEMELGREQALVGIFKSRYLKRFESSIHAFRISIRRALAFLQTFEEYLLDEKLLTSRDFQKALSFLAREDEEDDATPESLADEIDAHKEAKTILESMESVNPNEYKLRQIHKALKDDVETLQLIWDKVKDIDYKEDAKLNELKELLKTELQGKKVLIFTYYKDTARYLYKHLGHPDCKDAQKFRKEINNAYVHRMDGGVSPKDRVRSIKAFAPISNDKPEWKDTDKEIDILISTDVLSEGQNLQDCGYLVNYDLHWNPTRMVQRAGRIDRIGALFETLWIFNMFPDEGLERLLRLVERLMTKIAHIDKAGFLDASVLGETVHPRNFNTLKRIMEEDESVIEEEEQFSELVSSEFLEMQLRNLLDAGGKEMLEKLPDGIHSGLTKIGSKGIFFYFQAKRESEQKLHFWRYYDLKNNSIVDNRFLIANLIACEKDTPRIVDNDIFNLVFDLQEKVIENILSSFQQRQALEVAPRSVDSIQQTISTLIQDYLNHPEVVRTIALKAVRLLAQPMLTVQIKELKKLLERFQREKDPIVLIDEVIKLSEGFSEAQENGTSSRKPIMLKRDDLRLICFDVISGG